MKTFLQRVRIGSSLLCRHPHHSNSAPSPPCQRWTMGVWPRGVRARRRLLFSTDGAATSLSVCRPVRHEPHLSLPERAPSPAFTSVLVSRRAGLESGGIRGQLFIQSVQGVATIQDAVVMMDPFRNPSTAAAAISPGAVASASAAAATNVAAAAATGVAAYPPIPPAHRTGIIHPSHLDFLSYQLQAAALQQHLAAAAATAAAAAATGRWFHHFPSTIGHVGGKVSPSTTGYSIAHLLKPTQLALGPSPSSLPPPPPPPPQQLLPLLPPPQTR